MTGNSTTHPACGATLIKRMLIGGAIALGIITFFLLQVREPNQEWGKLWMIRPLIIVPLAGAVGGGFYHFINSRSYKNWRKALTVIIGLLVYIIGLWMGIVLGLDGTLWD